MAVSEKRRIVCKEECQCDSGDRSVRARLRDVSQEGVFVRTTDPFPIGERIHLGFQLEGKTVEATGMVRHSALGYGMGIEFLSMHEKYRRTIEEYVSAQIRRLRAAAYSRTRKASRTMFRTRVRVRGKTKNGEPFSEETETVDVSDIGARVLLTANVERGELLAVKALKQGGAWAQFRTVWQGMPGTAMEKHTGLELSFVDLWGLHELGRQ